VLLAKVAADAPSWEQEQWPVVGQEMAPWRKEVHLLESQSRWSQEVGGKQTCPGVVGLPFGELLRLLPSRSFA
jgi:hypothetical protein